MEKFQTRIKVYRPRTPFFLRPEVWLVLAGIGYFTYEKVNFYAPLVQEQNFPRGIVRGLSSSFERYLNEQEVNTQTWAMPINDYRRSLGQCFGVLTKEGSAHVELGGPVEFSTPLPAPKGEAVKEAGYVCQQDKTDRFSFALAAGTSAHVERAYDQPVALEVDHGVARLKVPAGGSLEVLLPNGLLALRSDQGFEGEVNRDEDILYFTVKKGTAEATPQFTTNYRAEAIGMILSAEGPAKLRLPNRAPAGEGKVFMAAPSGIYAQTK